MRAEPDAHATERLGEVLRQEADQVQVAPDARARLDRRIAGRPEPRARLRWPGPAVAVLALGLVLTVVLVISSGGWHRPAMPAPVASPSASATSSKPSAPDLSELDLPTTLIYYPRPDGRLMAEPRSRTTLAAAVGEMSGEPANEQVAWPFGSMTLTSVTEQDGTVTVDYAKDDHIRPGDPDVKTARIWAQSLVHTVAAYTGRQEPVRVTLRGQSFELFDRLDTDEPLRYADVDESLWVGVSRPTQVEVSSPATVVGAVGPRVERVTWRVVDPGTGQTLATGVVPVHGDHTYSFSLTAPPGQYDLRVYAGDPDDRSTPSYPGGFNIK